MATGSRNEQLASEEHPPKTAEPPLTEPLPTEPLRRALDGAWVSEDVGRLAPGYAVLLLAVDGLHPGSSDAASENVLSEAERAARDHLRANPLDELPQLREWRDAFTAFGAKPRRTRPSMEGLLRRLDQGLPRIDRLTDVYNAVSISHLLPIGGEDLDEYVGPPRLTRAAGDEDFDTVAGGEPVVEHPAPGEVVWRDDAGVTCRRWNWRQCVRTRITERTTRGLFILDGLPALGPDGLRDAGDRLAELLVGTNPGATVRSRLIAAADPARTDADG